MNDSYNPSTPPEPTTSLLEAVDYSALISATQLKLEQMAAEAIKIKKALGILQEAQTAAVFLQSHPLLSSAAEVPAATKVSRKKAGRPKKTPPVEAKQSEIFEVPERETPGEFGYARGEFRRLIRQVLVDAGGEPLDFEQVAARVDALKPRNLSDKERRLFANNVATILSQLRHIGEVRTIILKEDSRRNYYVCVIGE